MSNNFLFREKPARALMLMLNNNNNTRAILSRILEMTYSHTDWVINQCIKNELVSMEKKGRKQILTLTKKGKEIADLLSMIRGKINYNGQ